METLTARTFSVKREFLGRLPHGRDIITAVTDFCARENIMTGTFSLIGAVSSATLGTYDQKQQVYVTFQREGHLEILSGLGNISLKEGRPFVHAHVVLAEEGGATFGGHLFSETICFAGEIYIRELSGTALERTYDDSTGLMLWNMTANQPSSQA